MTIKVIVGLGNPGNQYIKTRHNAGFLMMDRMLDQYGQSGMNSLNGWKLEKKFQTLAATIDYNGHHFVLLKPQTFMNLSGTTVGSWCRFFRIEPKQVVVLHDDIDTPMGKIKLREGGGHGGHNGIRDIISKFGRDFYRVKIGLGKPEGGRPDHTATEGSAGYVLGKFTQQELDEVEGPMYDAFLERLDNVLKSIA